MPVLYEFVPGGLEGIWYDTIFAETDGAKFTGGYIKDGNLNGYIVDTFMGMLFGLYYGQVNLETGEVLKCEMLDQYSAPVYDVFAYSPAEERIYGFGNLLDYQNPVFMYTEEGNTSYATVVSELTDTSLYPTAICYNQNENALYGIDGNLNFTKYDLDGTITNLFSIDGIGASAGYYGGITYSPVEDLYYYAFINIETQEASLATINASSQSYDIVEHLEDSNQFRFLLCTDDYVTNEFAPQRPAVSEVGFPAGSLTGYVNFRMPDTFAGGDPIIPEDVIDVYVSLDGEPYTTATAKAGEIYSATFYDLPEGKHKFGCYVSVAGVNSGEISVSQYIGNDTPLAPTNVVLTNEAASWDAVPSVGVNNGYVDITAVEYVVYLNGEEYGRTNDCILPVKLPADKPLELYHVEVVAVFDGKSSKATQSNGVVAGKPLELPISIEPTEAQARLCATYDGTNNGAGWTYTIDPETETGMFQVTYSPAGTGEQDQWLFLPAMTLSDAAKYYTLNYKAGIRKSTYPLEYLSVYVGTAPKPEAMTIEVMEKYTPEPGFEFTETYFQVPQAGTYYVGFHCTSAQDQFGINLKDINVLDENMTAASPSAAYNLEAMGADEGELKANVTFNLPKKTMDDSDIASDAVVKATVVAADTVTVEGKPGEYVSVDVKTLQGNNTVSVRTSIGELNGPIVSIDVFTGVVVPMPVSNMQYTTSPDMMSVTMTWDAPTEGVEGGYINPETVTYSVFRLVETYTSGYWELIKGDIKDTTFTYQLEEGAKQSLASIGVATSNEAGMSESVVYFSDILGTPWALPMEETFDGGDVNYTPWIFHNLNDANKVSWAVATADFITEDADSSDYIFMATTDADNATGRLGIPRFTTAGAQEVELTFNVYAGAGSCEYKIYGFCYGMDEPIVLGTFNGNQADKGFMDVTVDLPSELIGKDWVQIYFDVNFTSPEQVGALSGFKAIADGIDTGIESIASGKSISAGKNMIYVNGFEGCNVVISSLNGAVVANGIATSNNQTYNLEKGVYVVKAGNRRAKVLVK